MFYFIFKKLPKSLKISGKKHPFPARKVYFCSVGENLTKEAYCRSTWIVQQTICSQKKVYVEWCIFFTSRQKRPSRTVWSLTALSSCRIRSGNFIIVVKRSQTTTCGIRAVSLDWGLKKKILVAKFSFKGFSRGFLQHFIYNHWKFF